MQKYDLFNLYIIEFEGIKYICEKNLKITEYNELFISKKFNEENILNI